MPNEKINTSNYVILIVMELATKSLKDEINERKKNDK